MDLDGRCDNRTPLVVRCLPLDDRHGRPVVAVIAKATFAVSPQGFCELCDEPRPIRCHDEWCSPAPRASLRFPSDAVDEKPGTDVLLIGTAQPPNASAAVMEVSLRWAAGDHLRGKTVRVHGVRPWCEGGAGIVPGTAKRLEPTTLCYERAFGGVDDSDPQRFEVDWRNPAGCGFARDRQRLVGSAAPELEDPRAPLDGSAPAPAGFGPVAAQWLPRSEWLGTCDAVWARERAPVRPVDFDPRHHCTAPADLHSEVPLVGDEAFEVVGVTAEGAWRFALPRLVPSFGFVVKDRAVKLDSHLDTVLIDADARLVELSWRASLPLPPKLEALQSIGVALGEGTDAAIRGARLVAVPKRSLEVRA